MNLYFQEICFFFFKNFFFESSSHLHTKNTMRVCLQGVFGGELAPNSENSKF